MLNQNNISADSCITLDDGTEIKSDVQIPCTQEILRKIKLLKNKQLNDPDKIYGWLKLGVLFQNKNTLLVFGNPSINTNTWKIFMQLNYYGNRKT